MYDAIVNEHLCNLVCLVVQFSLHKRKFSLLPIFAYCLCTRIVKLSAVDRHFDVSSIDKNRFILLRGCF